MSLGPDDERISDMKVVVTGGAGFIGANLVRMLAAQPWVDDVVVLDDLSTGSRANLDGVSDVEFVGGSVEDPWLVDTICRDADAIVHLAALPSVARSLQDPVSSHHANATGTLNVLEAARRADGPHVVVASSSSVYGRNPTLPKSEDLRPMPASPYAVTKLATEAYTLAYANCYGLPTLAFRFFNVFGPLQPAGHAYAAVVPAFLDAALAGRPLPLEGDGWQTRDFTYVGSVVSVIVDALRRRVTHEDPVNLAFGSRHSLHDLMHTIETLLGHAVEIDHRPPRPGDVRDSQADQARLHELFPDVPAVSLADGLRQTLEWMRTVQPLRTTTGHATTTPVRVDAAPTT